MLNKSLIDIVWDPALIFKIFSTIGHPETKRLNIDIQQLIKLSIVML